MAQTEAFEKSKEKAIQKKALIGEFRAQLNSLQRKENGQGNIKFRM